MGLIFSYLITGFFLKLRRTAVIPCIVSSNALVSHALTVEPYRGFDVEGVWFKEKREGVMGAKSAKYSYKNY